MGEAEPTVAFDVGNTSTKGAVLGAGGVALLLHLPTAPVETLAGRLARAMAESGHALATRAECVVSSVCPEANDSLRRFWEHRGQGGLVCFFGSDLPVPIPTLVREPSRVGTDRLLCALGAREIIGAPCVVVGVGTAITVDLVDAQGRFAGGAIAPGLSLAARALHEGTAALPTVEPTVPRRAAGRDTGEAMQSGIYHFCRAGAGELIGLLKEEAGGSVAVVVTGGDAPLLLPFPGVADVRHVPDLIFDGMAAALRSR